MRLNWFVLWVLVQGFMVFCSEHCLKILPKRPATKNTNQPRLLTSHLVSDVAGFGKGPMAWGICFTSLKQVSVGDDSYPNPWTLRGDSGTRKLKTAIAGHGQRSDLGSTTAGGFPSGENHQLLYCTGRIYI